MIFTRRGIEGLLFFAILTIALLGCGQSGPKPLSGKLTVLVRPPDRNMEPVPVEQAGAAPVQSGGAMCLDAKLDEPAFIYIVWLDAEGKVLPLYPWNNQRLEVTDISEPPPVRSAGKLVFSPLLGNNWTFGEKPGVETIVLLARRTALPEATRLADLLKSSAVPESAKAPQHVVEARLDSLTKSAAKATTTNDAALSAFLQPLNEHFDLIHAVQFTHSASAADGNREHMWPAFSHALGLPAPLRYPSTPQLAFMEELSWPGRTTRSFPQPPAPRPQPLRCLSTSVG